MPLASIHAGESPAVQGVSILLALHTIRRRRRAQRGARRTCLIRDASNRGRGARLARFAGLSQARHVRETVFASARAHTHEAFFIALAITDVARLARRVGRAGSDRGLQSLVVPRFGLVNPEQRRFCSDELGHGRATAAIDVATAMKGLVRDGGCTMGSCTMDRRLNAEHRRAVIRRCIRFGFGFGSRRAPRPSRSSRDPSVGQVSARWLHRPAPDCA